MRHVFFNTILFVISFPQLGCNRNKTSNELIKTFSNNKDKLDYIVHEIRSDKNLDSLFYHIGAENGIPDIEAGYPKLYKALKEAGITDASGHLFPCPQKTVYPEEEGRPPDPWYKSHWRGTWYYFKTNWNSPHPIFLIYNNCDTARTRKGFYEKDAYSNETWDMGGDWELFRLVEYINIRQ